jgi:acetyltransferase-like isoleucine patch superfamily enzyme
MADEGCQFRDTGYNPPSGRALEARQSPVSSAHREHDPRITVIQRELFDERRSKLQRYADLVVGRPGLWALFKFEAIVTLTSWVPGALGLLLRSRLYPRLLGRCGRNVTFGANVVLRHPHKISVGDNVVIDDNCCLDAKGSDNVGITIGSGVFVGRNTILSCKNGDIELDDQANIGFNVEIFAASRVRVGKKVLIAAYCYLVGGDHLYDRIDIAVLEQGRTARGIEVDDNAWLGAHAVVTDGSRVGKDAIIGAGAIVIGEIPDFSIAAGVPARILRNRLEGVPPEEAARGAGAVAPPR